MGKLSIVGVAIGNYDDMTLRAINTLKAADVIAAEDTRKTKHLLTHFNIQGKTLYAHHEHNERASAQGLIDLVKQGKHVALVTDAGMPAVSDPGYRLVAEAAEAGIELEIVPGVSASLTAVAISGLPSDRFLFVGFLPRKAGERDKLLADLAKRPETLIFYESPRRLLESLTAMHTAFGNRPACLCRELTKTYEEIIRQPLADISIAFKDREVLGELTLVVAGASEDALVPSQDDLDAAIRQGLADGLSTKDLQSKLADTFHVPKRQVYQRILELAKD